MNKNGSDKSRGRTSQRPSKRKFFMSEVAPTPAPKRKKFSVPSYLGSPVAGIAPTLVSPKAGISAYTPRPGTPWPTRHKLPTRIFPRELRQEDRNTYISDLKQGLASRNHPDASIENFAMFEYVGIVCTTGQRREKGYEFYDDADQMVKGISEHLYKRNLNKFFGGFIGLDVIINKQSPDGYRIVHQIFCGSKTDVKDLTRRLYDDSRLCMIIVMTGEDHVPESYVDKIETGCFLRDSVELGDFLKEAGVPIHFNGGSTYGAQQVMPTPRRPTGPAAVPGTAPAPPAPPETETKPPPPAPHKMAKTEENPELEVTFVTGIPFSGDLELVAFKHSDYIAMHKAMVCIVRAGLTEDSAKKAVKTLRSVRERVKIGSADFLASISSGRAELLDF